MNVNTAAPPQTATRPDAYESLRAAIEARTCRVGIIGLGYVGLPLARAFADRGVAVLGFDVDPAKVREAPARAELHRPHHAPRSSAR